MSDLNRILVITKAPDAGRAKTRLCPPCTYEAAATIAEAALRDTLDAVIAVRDAEPVIVLDGETGSWLPPGVQVLTQRGDGLGDRIANAFADAGTPALLIGMDTPQVTTSMLEDALNILRTPGVDAVLGRADDGGWWAIGFRRPAPGAFAGVPMSTSHTATAQRRRLMELGLRTTLLPTLRDVDTFSDAIVVADEIPGSRFARSVHASVPAAVARWASP